MANDRNSRAATPGGASGFVERNSDIELENAKTNKGAASLKPWWADNAEKYRKKHQKEMILPFMGLDMGLSEIFKRASVFSTPEKAAGEITSELFAATRDVKEVRGDLSKAMQHLGYGDDNPAVKRLNAIYEKAFGKIQSAAGSSDWVNNTTYTREAIQQIEKQAGSSETEFRSFHGRAIATAASLAELSSDLNDFARDYPEVIKQVAIDDLTSSKADIAKADYYKPGEKESQLAKIDSLIADVRQTDRLSPADLIKLDDEEMLSGGNPDGIGRMEVQFTHYGSTLRKWVNDDISIAGQEFLGESGNGQKAVEPEVSAPMLRP